MARLQAGLQAMLKLALTAQPVYIADLLLRHDLLEKNILMTDPRDLLLSNSVLSFNPTNTIAIVLC
jgi:hypothetical protein